MSARFLLIDVTPEPSASEPSPSCLDGDERGVGGSTWTLRFCAGLPCRPEPDLVALISALSGKKTAKGGKSSRALLEAVTRREQSLALFHLLGKVLYNKRALCISASCCACR